jgi:hypothetical protein
VQSAHRVFGKLLIKQMAAWEGTQQNCAVSRCWKLSEKYATCEGKIKNIKRASEQLSNVHRRNGWY